MEVFFTDTGDLITITDHVPGFPNDTIREGPDTMDLAIGRASAAGSDVETGSGLFSAEALGFSDTTFVTASGDGGWVLFGEGAASPTGRLIMYEASSQDVSRVV